jgi:hypothetical protein
MKCFLKQYREISTLKHNHSARHINHNSVSNNERRREPMMGKAHDDPVTLSTLEAKETHKTRKDQREMAGFGERLECGYSIRSRTG